MNKTLQQQFAHIVQKHERLRTQQREAERQADPLFQTLLHRAFNGELTSNAQEFPPPAIDNGYAETNSALRAKIQPLHLQ